MGFTAGKAFVEFNALDRGLGRYTSSLNSKFSLMAGKLGRIALGVGAISAVGAGIYKSTKLAGDAVEDVSKFEAVFKDQSKAAMEFANNLSESVGRSKYELVKFLSTLQDTFVPLGYTRDKAREMAQQMVELAVDVASFNNKADDEVLRDFQSAIVGNHETVRKYGIIITEERLKQEALNASVWDGKGDLDALTKVQMRMNLILRGTKDAQGDALRTSGALSNQVKRLQSSFKDLSTDLGMIFIPIATTIVSKLGDFVVGMKGWASYAKTAFDYVEDRLRSLYEVLSFVFNNWESLGKLTMVSMVLGMVSFWEDLKYSFTTKIPAVLLWFFNNWKDVFKTMWSFTKSVFSNLYENITNFFASLIAYIVYDVPWDYMWTPLLDGFENSIKELPEIAERGMTDLEKQLTDRMGKLSEKVAKEWLDSQKDKTLDFNEAQKEMENTAVEDVINKTNAKTNKSPMAKFSGLTDLWKNLATAGASTESKLNNLQQQSLDTQKRQLGVEEEIRKLLIEGFDKYLSNQMGAVLS